MISAAVDTGWRPFSEIVGAWIALTAGAIVFTFVATLIAVTTHNEIVAILVASSLSCPLAVWCLFTLLGRSPARPSTDVGVSETRMVGRHVRIFISGHGDEDLSHLLSDVGSHLGALGFRPGRLEAGPSADAQQGAPALLNVRDRRGRDVYLFGSTLLVKHADSRGDIRILVTSISDGQRGEFIENPELLSDPSRVSRLLGSIGMSESN